MERKTEVAYTALLKIIFKKFLKQISDKNLIFHTDFELAERNAIQAVIPRASVQYCMFHFFQVNCLQ